MPERSLSGPRLALAAVLVAVLGALPDGPRVSRASERTFLVTPGEIVSGVDRFNGRLLVGSAALSKRVKVLKGGTMFDRVKCPSLAADPGRSVSRILVLDSAERAASLAGTRKPRPAVAAALNLLGADTWQPPAIQFSSTVPGWTAQPLVVGPVLPVFQASGAVGGSSSAASAWPGHFRFVLDLASGQAGPEGAFSLVMAVRSQPLEVRRGKPKPTECFFVLNLVPADMEELGRRLAEASLPVKARSRLQGLFDRASSQLAAGKMAGAKDSLATFAGEAGKRMTSQIDAETAGRLIEQALRVIEAL